jgi:hypothetical protein
MLAVEGRNIVSEAIIVGGDRRLVEIEVENPGAETICDNQLFPRST